MDLYNRLRSKTVLHRAWAKVRASGFASESETTKRATEKFDADWLNELEKIRHGLQHRNFVFAGEKGVALPKGKGKTGFRPLVVAPIANRVVRRALLEILQGYGEADDKPRRRWAGVPEIRAIMATRTSVGGISERGVPHGLALIDHEVRAKNHYFVRSDIRDFFTRIPKSEVTAFVSKAVSNSDFASLFERALETNLNNQEELEERKHFKLFPDPAIGVAQGSALSALAGNITLRDFDSKMNERGIVCVRYIDDFILLGPSVSKVQAAYQSARKILSALGMDVYDVNDATARKDGKVDAGNLYNGTDVLGYRISGTSRQPSDAACKKFLAKLDKVVTDCLREMKLAVGGNSNSHQWRYHQSMVQMHKIVWGWSQSFRHTTAMHVFKSLDREIDARIKLLSGEANGLIPIGDVILQRRVMGLHLLADTKEFPLPEVGT